jgi:UrcA family protein
MIKTFVSLALLLAAAVPSAATAQDFSGNSVRVSYRDLNLGTPDGVAELDHRIARAINTVCPDPKSRVLSAVQASRACRIATTRWVADQRNQALAKRNATLTIVAAR